jgi:hypothetical protein
MAFLRGETDEHHQADLREDVDIRLAALARQPQPEERAEGAGQRPEQH